MRRILNIAVIASVSAGLAHAATPAGMELVESNPRGVTVRFRLENVRVDTLQLAEGTFLRVGFDDCTYSRDAGRPQAPYAVLALGVPEGAAVTARLVGQREARELEGRLLPSPRLIRKGGLPAEAYVPDRKTYREDGPFPAEMVTVSSPEKMRDLSIVHLTIRPVQYFPAQQRIRVHGDLLIRVDFTGGDADLRASPVPRLDRGLYQAVVANHDVARGWVRRPAPARLSKPAVSPAEGDWYKVSVNKEGIHQIKGSALTSRGVDISSIDPRTIKIFNNGGTQLDERLGTPRPDSLIEHAIRVVGESDGKFDSNDQILFYGYGASHWNHSGSGFRHYLHPYDTLNVYWLTWGGQPGRRMESYASREGVGVNPEFSYRKLHFVEEERHIPLHSGRNWYSHQFVAQDSATFYFDVSNPLPVDSVTLRFRLVGMTSDMHTFRASWNGQFMGGHSFRGSNPYHGPVLRIVYWDVNVAAPSQPGENRLEIEYQGGSEFAQAYIDWVEVETGEALKGEGNYLAFFSEESTTRRKYTISNFPQSGVDIYRIPEYHGAQMVTGAQIGGGVYSFTADADQPTGVRYILTTGSNYQTPVSIDKDIPSDLRNPANGADYVIITHKDFQEQAMYLVSLRENWDNLRTKVVLVSDIYDEFSWGQMDPVAIRDFLTYAYHNWSLPPHYVLLFGDGDYDYRNIKGDADRNWVPPYETSDGRAPSEITTRTMDAFYTYVSGTETDNIMDLAMGRLTVQTPEEARLVVDKIVGYETTPQHGPWRNTITGVADDELVDGGTGSEFLHTVDAERMYEQRIPKTFDLVKIYLMQYRAIQSASISGVRKPGAQRAIVDQLNRGTLIINYVGHGNPHLWAHERVFTINEDLDRIDNPGKLTFYVAATCDWARFDDPLEQSMAERLMVMEDRGAIGVLSSARLVFAGSNVAFNRAFYQHLFRTQGKPLRLGDALLETRGSFTTDENDEKYFLLGDPAMTLKVPRYQARVTDMQPDSIRALSRITVRGDVERDGQKWDDFQGTVLLTARDSKKHITYQGSGFGSATYWIPGNTIFRGEASVVDGGFDVDFIVPKDITYGGNLGRLEAYFWNDEVDGSGNMDSLSVGGTATDLVDLEGPSISISFKSQPDFIDGDMLERNPTLSVELEDTTSGINITGEIGHGITMILDDQRDDPIALNDYFRYYQDSHVKGVVEYPVSELSEGRHQIEIKAWDNFNNSNSAAAGFEITSDNRIVIRDLLNYPNPMRNETTITFQLSKAGDVDVKLYTLSGKLIRQMSFPGEGRGFKMLAWDGLDEDGDQPANGVYIYKVIARSTEGDEVENGEAIGKLIIAR